MKIQFKTPIQFKGLGSLSLFFKEINYIIQQGCIKLIKSDSKYIVTNIQSIFQINAVLLYFLFIKEWFPE